MGDGCGWNDPRQRGRRGGQARGDTWSPCRAHRTDVPRTIEEKNITQHDSTPVDTSVDPPGKGAPPPLDHTTEGAPVTETIEDLAARAPVRPDSPTFRELGARHETVEALEAAGISRAFAIQEYAIPAALRGSDLIGQAPTGTGKTLGFGVPILEHITGPHEGASGVPQALVVVPTRELCLQVSRDLEQAGSRRDIRVLPVYGGVTYDPQVNMLRSGVDLVVGTPGRLLDLADGRHLRLDQVQILVLDEADRMLDLGFAEDVEKILGMLPERRQTMLFSATMPDPIVRIARRFLHQPLTIHANHAVDTGPSPDTEQFVYRTHPLNKLEVLARVLQAKDRSLTMVFCRTKRTAQKVADDLDFRGFAAAPVHGDLGQAARERALRAFRTGKVDILVATDVAARGLDVTGVSHVVNYDCPEDAETYVHRIGRTGRAGATGVAVTFVDWEDMPRWRLVNTTLGVGVPEPAETYHTSAHLFDDLHIPEGVSGTLPSAQRTRAGLNAEATEDIEPRRRAGRPRRPGRGDSGRGDSGRGEPARRQSSRGGTGERTGERRRRRTRRNGTAAGAGSEGGRTDVPDASQPATPQTRSDTPSAPAAGGPAPARRRRRRRRGSSSGTTDGTGTSTG